MNNTDILNKLLVDINNLYNYANENDLFSKLSNYENENIELKNNVETLKTEIKILNNTINESKEENFLLKQKIENLELEIINKNDIINKNIEETQNFSKVSYTQQLTKQISELSDIIKNLENQLKKNKNDKLEYIENIKRLENELKLKSESDDIESIDINGYELLLYKNNYYLKNNNTNELYDIKNKKPNKLVGIIKSSGKVKFNN
jgi:predicted RNase H-like nuclease (RuvC/YqgF family)